MFQSLIRKTSIVSIFSLLMVLVLPLVFADKAEAAILQQAWVRLDRMVASTATTGMVCMKTAAVDVTEADVTIVFPTGFNVSATTGNWTVTTSNLPSGATIWPGIGTATAANNGTRTVTFPSSNLATNTLYCFNWDNTAALTTGSSGPSQTGTMSSGGNTSPFALALVTAGGDQIGVTATVPAIFTFSLGGTTAAIGTLSTTTASASGVTANIATNATSGWVAWVKSANAALNSASTGASIATAGTVDNAPTDLAGTTGYVLDVDVTTDSATGTGTITQASGYGAEYNGTNTTSGGTLSTTFQPIAASSGTTDGDVLTLIPRAKITVVQTPASDYTDTLTVVAAGRF